MSDRILGGSKVFSDMAVLVLVYMISITVVQSSRYLKRFYVRRFANNVNRSWKQVLFGSLTAKVGRTSGRGWWEM